HPPHRYHIPRQSLDESRGFVVSGICKFKSSAASGVPAQLDANLVKYSTDTIHRKVAFIAAFRRLGCLCA
ncbi:hypothetical protein, partial [Vibrio parahaemolyticus]|uniref:hypothetical protein n=1 Tax=Vibrio parahaemolyticus TaxID=670 RepID=UPI001E57B4A7